MLRKILSLVLIMVLMTTLIGGGSAFAESNSSKIDNIEEKIDAKEEQIDENNEKKENLEDRIASLESKIDKAEKELKSLRTKITKNTNKVNKVNAKIEKLKKKIVEQQDLLDKRLRSMYKNGNMGIIEVLLGSVDIQDFMSNFKLINELHKSDVEVLEELEENRKVVKEQKEELDNLVAKLKDDEALEASKQSKLEADQSELATAKAKIEAENAELTKDIDALNAESSRLAAEMNNYDDGGAKYTGNGQFTWPFPGYSRVSSEYGWRTHPITGKKKFHSGIDLAGPYGSSIVAAEDGTVVKAGWNSGGYGNYVIISHGSGLSTLYGHNSSVTVSAGQKVKRGQTIAKCGSTGLSTGNHLHFEVMKGGSTVNPRGYI
jgi:murein DD-endopeptidase MepM/ murein hydrolase activator NlpD